MSFPVPGTEVCTNPERGADDEEEDKSESESGEPFCLEDILDAVTFEDEPLRMTTTTKTTTTTTTQDPEDGLPEDPEMAMMETESVISEDVQLTEDVRSRPCEFIPPPPPRRAPSRLPSGRRRERPVRGQGHGGRGGQRLPGASQSQELARGQ